MPRRSPEERAALLRAKARLDRLDYYPRPVELRGVRIVHVPWFFRLPFFRRFHGYATRRLILIRRPLPAVSDSLIVHELCHIWQQQHRPITMPLSYLTRGYRHNPYEVEARRAVAETCAG